MEPTRTNSSLVPRPIDTGYAWVICFASFTCVLLFGLAMQTMNVLLLEICEELQSTVSKISVGMTCVTLGFSVTTLFGATKLVPMFGERVVTVVAGLGLASCSMMNSLVPNLQLFCAVCFLQGLFAGALFVPSLAIVTLYFDKKRSLASTITSSGVCVATIVFPPLIRYVHKQYGLRGTFLILGAVELHLLVAGLLLRPVTVYRPLSPSDPVAAFSEETEVTEYTDNVLPSSLQSRIAALADSFNKDTSQEGTPTSKSHGGTPILKSHDGTPTTKSHDGTPISKSHEGTPISKSHGVTPLGKYIDGTLISMSRTSLALFEEIGPSNSREQSKSALNSRQQSKATLGSRQQSKAALDAKHSTNSLGTDMAVLVDVELSQQLYSSEASKDIKEKKPAKSILRSKVVIMWIVATILAAVNQYIQTYIPTMTVLKGATADQSALCFMVTGVVDLNSRIIVGFIADRQCLKPIWLIVIAQAGLGIVCLSGLFATTFPTILAWSAATGMFVGIRFSLLAVGLIQLFGEAKMRKLLSFTVFFGTLASAMYGPGLNRFMEAMDSYDPVLIYMSCSLFIGAIVISLLPMLGRREEMRELKLKAKNRGPSEEATYAESEPQSVTHSARHSNRHSKTHINTHSDTHSSKHSNKHGNKHSNTHSNTHSGTHSETHSKTHSVSSSDLELRLRDF